MIERMALRNGTHNWVVSEGDGAHPPVLYLDVNTRTKSFRMQITAPLPKEDTLNTSDLRLAKDIRDALNEAVRTLELITA